VPPCYDIPSQKCRSVYRSPLVLRLYRKIVIGAAWDLHLEEEVRQEEADETQYSGYLDGHAFCALRPRCSSDLGGRFSGGRTLTLSQAFMSCAGSSIASCISDIALRVFLRDIIHSLGGCSSRCRDIGVILVFRGGLGRRSVAASGSVLIRRGVGRRGDVVRGLLNL
jgi:hypothetical protein